jgi:hypothetical protein
MLYPGSGPDIFPSLIPDLDPNILHPGSDIKRGARNKSTFFLATYGFRGKFS